MKAHPLVLGVLAVAASLIVAGCAAPPFKPFFGSNFKACKTPAESCDVAVSVSCPADATKPCTLSADPDLVLLSKSNGAHLVNWRLEDGGPFEFTADGISFPTDFACTKRGPFMFVCDTSTTAVFTAYKYTVKAMPRSGSRPVDPLDPWVVTN